MIQSLQNHIIEAEHPVGCKKTSNWKLPPPDFAYGLQVKPDAEGVSVVTRSWKVHQPSRTAQPPQDFITINKMAIKMNATTYGTHKDFRKHVDIKQKMRHGNKTRKITLPPDDFAYGLPNRPPTPIKDVINYGYANRAEEVIKEEYKNYMKEKQMSYHLAPKTTDHFNKLMQTRKMTQNVQSKPPYKMKMFQNVGSKVAEGIKEFKTFYPKNRKNNLDNLIDKVQGEINEVDKEQNNGEK